MPVGQMIGICLNRNFAYAEIGAAVVKHAGKIGKRDRRRAAADIHALKVVAKVFIHGKLKHESVKIGPGACLVIAVAVE